MGVQFPPLMRLMTVFQSISLLDLAIDQHTFYNASLLAAPTLRA
jgi:hypothetical protein